MSSRPIEKTKIEEGCGHHGRSNGRRVETSYIPVDAARGSNPTHVCRRRYDGVKSHNCLSLGLIPDPCFCWLDVAFLVSWRQNPHHQQARDRGPRILTGTDWPHSPHQLGLAGRNVSFRSGLILNYTKEKNRARPPRRRERPPGTVFPPRLIPSVSKALQTGQLWLGLSTPTRRGPLFDGELLEVCDGVTPKANGDIC